MVRILEISLNDRLLRLVDVPVGVELKISVEDTYELLGSRLDG